MPIFVCQPCKYTTDSKSNHNKHIKTSKHVTLFSHINYDDLDFSYNGVVYKNNVNNNHSHQYQQQQQQIQQYQPSIPQQQQHQQLQLTQSTNYYCHSCHISYRHSQSYRRHIRNKHNGIEPIDPNTIQNPNDLLDIIQDLQEDIKTVSQNIANNSYNTANHSHNTNTNSHNVDNSHYKTINNVNVAGDYNQNNMKINITYLNQNFSQMIPIQTFIDGIQDKYRLTLDDANRLLKSRDAGVRFFKKEFSKLIKEKCKDQIRDLGIDLPSEMFPIITTDTNLRTHNEKTNNGWQRTGKTDKLEKIYNIYNDQIFQLTNQYIFLDDKSLIELYNFIRRDNFMFSDNANGQNQYQQIQLENGQEIEPELSQEEIEAEEARKRKILFEEKKKEFERTTGRKFMMLPLD